jgi:hypothetical protein
MVNLSRAVAVAVGILLAGGVAVAPAFADTATGPNSVACANANAAVLAAALAANAEAQKVDGQQAVVLVGLKAAVKTASDAVDAANTAYQAAAKIVKDAGDAATAAQIKDAADKLTLLVTAQLNLKVAVANLAGGPELTPAQKSALDEANAKVAAAIERRTKSCDDPGPTVTVTPTPTPTVTVTATPVPNDDDDDDAPSSVNTGRA